MSDLEKLTKHVETLVAKAAEQEDSGDAMRFAQAALNAAHCCLSLRDISEGSK